jgi:hypothetical protein
VTAPRHSAFGFLPLETAARLARRDARLLDQMPGGLLRTYGPTGDVLVVMLREQTRRGAGHGQFEILREPVLAENSAAFGWTFVG